MPDDARNDACRDRFARVRLWYLRAAMATHFGEYMAMMVTSYVVFHLTHSISATGLILLCYNVPAVLLAPLATTLTRRYGAPRVDAWLNAFEGLIALAPMTFAATHHLTTTVLLAWVLGFGVLEGLNAPNSLLVRQLIAAPGRLYELNSSYTRNVALAAVVGVVVGGYLYTSVGPTWVFLICAVTAVPEVIVFAVAHHRTDEPSEQPASHSLVRALRLMRTEPGLWAAIRFAVLCFFVAGYAVTLPAIANTIGSSAEFLALLESGSLLGGVLVAAVVRRVHGRVRWGVVQRWCFAGAGTGLAVMALAQSVAGAHSRVAAAVALAATVPVGFAVLMNASIVTSLIQIGTPSEQRTSMYTLLALIPLAVGPASQQVIGVVADATSVPTALGLLALVTVVVSSAVSHRPMSVHFDALDSTSQPFAVNAILTHRSAHRGYHRSDHHTGAV